MMQNVTHALVAAAIVCTSQAAFAADADNGSRLAQRWCASCHIISSGQRTGTDIAPSFASIAQKPGFTAEGLAFFLLEPHPKMPTLSLMRAEAQDLAAYIAAQR
jgi:mono/diheme cytochrome c family protein